MLLYILLYTSLQAFVINLSTLPPDLTYILCTGTAFHRIALISSEKIMHFGGVWQAYQCDHAGINEDQQHYYKNLRSAILLPTGSGMTILLFSFMILLRMFLLRYYVNCDNNTSQLKKLRRYERQLK